MQDRIDTLENISGLKVRAHKDRGENIFTFSDGSGRDVKAAFTYPKAKLFAEGIQYATKGKIMKKLIRVFRQDTSSIGEYGLDIETHISPLVETNWLTVSPRMRVGDVREWARLGNTLYLITKDQTCISEEDEKHLPKETWELAVSKQHSGMDSLWKSSFGRFCVTDGTHPARLDDPVDSYIIDIERLKEPVVIGKGIGAFPNISQFSADEPGLKSHRAMEQYFLSQGIIDKPITYILGA